MDESRMLCGANSYQEKYYFNERFKEIPKSVQDRLHAMCVLYTEQCGGILTMEFMEDGTLVLKTAADDFDYYYDEIEAGLQISRLQKEEEELFSSLELYYRVKFLGEKPEMLSSVDLGETKQ